MNQLLLKNPPVPGEMITVTGTRAEHIRTVLRSKPGDTLKVGVLNGKSGCGMIRSVEKGAVTLDSFIFDSEAPAPLPITLAVALPRPQSLKKVLHFASSAGIPELILFQSARVEKSYWNSSVLHPEELEKELLEGMEQGCTTRMPLLRFYRTFREFMTAMNERQEEFHRIVAHPVPQQPFTPKPDAEKILLTIGPEGGFLPSEVAAFENNGFQKFSCGKHILRVEFACAFLCGMLI